MISGGGRLIVRCGLLGRILSNLEVNYHGLAIQHIRFLSVWPRYAIRSIGYSEKKSL